MRVSIDITALMYGRGVSRYTANLVKALSLTPTTQLQLFGYSWRQHRELYELAHQALKQDHRHQIKIQKYPPRLQNVLWNYLKINSVGNLFPKTDVIHSWDWLQPPDKNIPLVSTIHDVAILKYPDTAHPDILAKHQRSWAELKNRQAQIIAVSHSTRNDIIELLGFSPNQVHVIYEALPEEVKHVSELIDETMYEVIKNKLQLNKPFILFVGTREPRKNLQRLIDAWQPLATQVDLLIAGEKGWDETSQHDQRLTVKHQPRFMGKVTDKELSVLYSEASLLAYPCLDEGFGLPILEAFYYGTPVVTSNVSAMKEVAGNAAELIDPLSVESISAGLEKVLNESLADQQQRLKKMIIRLHMFNWHQVATDTLKIYQYAIDTFQG